MDLLTAVCKLARSLVPMLVALLAACPIPAAAQADVQVITRAETALGDGDRWPEQAPHASVELPDDWTVSHPHHDGKVWYRVRFAAPPQSQRGDLLALYVERVCSNLEVVLNGRLIFSGGRMDEPVTRNCHYPQLVTLPSGLLLSTGNVLDLRVHGHAAQRVAARQRAGGLSELRIGPQAALAELHAERLFWNVGSVLVVSLVLGVLGLLMVGLNWNNPRDPSLTYLGLTSIGWASLSTRLWWRDIPLDDATAAWTAMPIRSR